MIQRALTTIRRSFDRWVDHQDHAAVREGGSLGAWVVLTGALLLLFWAAAFAPIVGPFFRLPFDTALFLAAPMVVQAITEALLYRGKERLPRYSWYLSILGSFFMYFMVAGLTAITSLQSAPIFAGMLLFTTAYHGWVMRVTLREPFIGIMVAFAWAGGAFLARSDGHLAILAVAGPFSVAATFFAGSVALASDRARKESQSLRAAVQAQILADQQRELGRLSGTVVELLGTSHDANNALTAANLSAETMLAMLESDSSAEQAELRGLATEVVNDLGKVAAVLGHARDAAKREKTPSPEPVEIETIVDLIESRQSVLYPDVRFRKSLTGEARASVAGGQTTLHRVIDNLVLNACQGDGTRGASQVEVVIEPADEQHVSIIVRDDGPGFRSEQLKSRIVGFETSKAQGTGLGLYTSERLVRASGGTLVRANRPDGGAEVMVVLPRA